MASLFYLVTGGVGGGKTMYVVEQCIQALKEGAQVFSNIAWRSEWVEANGYGSQIHALPEDSNTWTEFIQGGEEGAENVFAVDESTYLFHVWDQAGSKKTNRKLFELLPMVRKVGLESYMICQDAGNIDVAIRRQATAHVHCINMTKLPGLARLLGYFLGDFKRSFRNPTKRTEISAKYCKFNKTVAAAYHTDATTGEAASRLERNVTRNQKAVERGFRRPLWFWPAVLGTPVLIFLGFTFTAAKTMAIGKNGQKAAAPAAHVETAAAPSGPGGFTPPPMVEKVTTRDVDGLEIKDGEFVLASAIVGSTIKLRTREGVVFTPGSDSDFGMVHGITIKGQRYYVDTDGGLFVVRPITAMERRKLYTTRAKEREAVPAYDGLQGIREATGMSPVNVPSFLGLASGAKE